MIMASTTTPRKTGSDDVPMIELARVTEFFSAFRTLNRDVTFQKLIHIGAKALIGLFNAEHATMWAPIGGGKFGMAYSTFDDRMVELLRMRKPTGISRTAKCFKDKLPEYYPTLDSYPPCVHREILENERYTATWCLPLRVGSAASSSSSYVVVTIDGEPDKMLPKTDRVFLQRVVAWAGSQVERAMWYEQDTLLRHVRDAIDRLDSDSRTAIDGLATCIAKVLNFESCEILTADDATAALYFAGSSRAQSGKIAGRRACNYGEGCVGTAAKTRKICRTDGRDPILANARSSANSGTTTSRDGLAAPIMSPRDHLIGVVFVTGKLATPESSTCYPLNSLDEQRIEHVSHVVAPLLKLVHERRSMQNTIRRVWHDVRMPSTMIRDFAAYYLNSWRKDKEHFLARSGDEFFRKLVDCVAMSEEMILLSDSARLSADEKLCPRIDGSTNIFRNAVVPICKMLTPESQRQGLQGVFYDWKSFQDAGSGASDLLARFPQLWIDVPLFKIALYNVIQNAIKYSVTGGCVNVDAAFDVSKQAFAVNVKNFGIEIDERDSDRVFDPFFRTAQAQRITTSGVGLGLTIARAIMESHEGGLELTNRDPTTFTLWLPKKLVHGKPDEKKTKNSNPAG